MKADERYLFFFFFAIKLQREEKKRGVAMRTLACIQSLNSPSTSSSTVSHLLLLPPPSIHRRVFAAKTTLVLVDHEKKKFNKNSSILLSRRSRFSVLAAQKQQPDNSVNAEDAEDTDEMFDDLFDKYGEVVYRSTDQKSPSSEAGDDAESLSFAIEMAKVASDTKAADIRVLFVKPLVYWTRFFIIVTAYSLPQVNAIGSKIRDLAEEKYNKIATGDYKPNTWTLLDFGDVVVHIFLPPQRTFYNLEEFYANATSIELPFEQEPQLRD